MSVSLARRALLRGRFSGPAPVPLRPPWALSENSFTKLCSRCDACRKVCSSGILVRGSGGYPEVDFSSGEGECTFCAECVSACESKALDRVPDSRPWTAVAAIGGACLSAQGVTCRVCGDVCEARAIRFKLAVGGIAEPILDTASCTGCGACVAPCPTNAIAVSSSIQEASS